MSDRIVALLTLTLLMGLAAPAGAQVCVVVETDKDNLSLPDRAAAQAVLEDFLASQGLAVGPSPCDQPYRVHHLRLGESITVVMRAGDQIRQKRVSRLAEVPAAYDQMVRSLRSGVPIDTASAAVTRGNVTDDQQAPKRVEADAMWHLALGPGTILGGEAAVHPRFALGYRYELDSVGIDASMGFLLPTDEGDQESDGFTASLIRLMGIYFLSPTTNSTLYLGGGMSWGTSTVIDADQREFTDSGIQVELAVGYEFLRASTIRMFVQAEATLPMYSTQRTDAPFGGAVSDETRYTPSFALVFGMCLGKPRFGVVGVIH